MRSIQQQLDFFCRYGERESEELKKLSREELIALVEYGKITIENLHDVKPVSEYLKFQKPVDIVSFEVIDCLETTKTKLVDNDFINNVALIDLSKKVKLYHDMTHKGKNWRNVLRFVLHLANFFLEQKMGKQDKKWKEATKNTTICFSDIAILATEMKIGKNLNCLEKIRKKTDTIMRAIEFINMNHGNSFI